MAFKVKVDVKAAVDKLSGEGYRVRINKNKVRLYITDGSHINVDGSVMPLRDLVHILVHGNESTRMPPRPFTVDFILELRSQFKQILAHNVVFHKRNTKNANYVADVYVTFDEEAVCLQCAALMRYWLASGYYLSTAPNAPSTVARKGFNLPLVDSGQLVNAINAKIISEE